MKMLKYVRMKEKLFGKERCLRPILFSDLQQDAQDSIRSGAVVFHDNCNGFAARPMMVLSVARWKTQSALSQVQASFYMSHIFSRSREVQQRGMVAVVYTIGTNVSHFQRALAMMKYDAMDARPVRTAGLHICFSNPLFKPIVAAIFQAMPRECRLRSKLHCGSPQQCRDELVTYGIPAGILPVGDMADCGAALGHELVERCLQRDRDAKNTFYEGKPEHCIGSCPREKDVLFGRGRPYQRFSGNMQFSALLQRRKASYNDPTKTRADKTDLIQEMVKQIRASGTRFLKRDDSGDWWEEVSDHTAKRRVAMSLRNMSRK